VTTAAPGRLHIAKLAARQPWFVAQKRRICIAAAIGLVLLLVGWKVAAHLLRERLAHDSVELVVAKDESGGPRVYQVKPIPGAYFYLNLLCSEKYLVAEYKRTKDIDCFAAVLIRSGKPYTAEQFREAFALGGAVVMDD